MDGAVNTLTLRLVPGLNDWQQLVHIVGRELRRRGYDVRGATNERCNRIACTLPDARRLMDKMGFEWLFNEFEQIRLAECVRSTMTFKESRTFYFSGVIDVAVRSCPHGRVIYCHECWDTNARK